eukprot:scaffold10228_cov111-Isochrysis_galbana.AAC.2
MVRAQFGRRQATASRAADGARRRPHVPCCGPRSRGVGVARCRRQCSHTHRQSTHTDLDGVAILMG